MTSHSAFKGPYCTELRSAKDNALHPIAIQTFFTTLSNMSFFLSPAFSHGKPRGQWKKPPAPFMVTIFAHDKVYSSLVCQLSVKRMNPGIDFSHQDCYLSWFCIYFSAGGGSGERADAWHLRNFLCYFWAMCNKAETRCRIKYVTL